MKYNELIRVYFELSSALQWYWNLLVIVIGGLMGFSLFRQRRDFIRTVFITVLFCCFAYKNLDAIQDVSLQRFATLKAIKEYPADGPDAADIKRVRGTIEPTLMPPEFEGVRIFHIASDVLTVAALWAMEFRRKKEDQA